MKVNGLSKQQAGTGSSPRGAHALEGPQSHAAMPKKQRFWLWSPNRTSIHHSIDPTPQPTHPGSGVPRRIKAGSEGLGSRKRARGTDSLEKQPHVRKEVTIPPPKEHQCHHPGEPSRRAVALGLSVGAAQPVPRPFPCSLLRLSQQPGQLSSRELPSARACRDGGVAPGRADTGGTQRQKLLGGVTEG